jgi:CRISPR-associated protein Cas1
MIKRTLYFGNPCYLYKRQDQLVVSLDDTEKTVPLEDIGMVILDHYQIKITQPVLQALAGNNAAVLVNDTSHLPLGLMLPMASHNTYTEKLHYQVNASQPLKKNLWQQTVKKKIRNQAALLRKQGLDPKNMEYWASQVKSGDPDNYEGRAAAFYWQALFDTDFRRRRYGAPPNNLLNYGYAILRAVVARSLVASGMLPALGIHHRNKYDAYCLADDMMEPYRPYVDQIVLSLVDSGEDTSELTTSLKRKLLQIPVTDIFLNGNNSPLMVGMQQTTASLMRCFEGQGRKIAYPEFQ